MADHPTHDLTDELPFEELVKELDALLDAWFMKAMEPVSRRGGRSRSASDREAA